MKTPKISILIVLAIVFAAGCSGGVKRPYAASEAVLTFDNALWVQLPDGRFTLAAADWRVEKEMTLDDVQHEFRQGVVLTPGHMAKVFDALEKGTSP